MTNAERTMAPLEQPIETGPESGALGLVSDRGSWTRRAGAPARTRGTDERNHGARAD
jgi:hypothetical protein